MVDPIVAPQPDSTRFSLWKNLASGFLKRTVKTGTLALTFPDASINQFGSGKPCVAATITSPRSLRRIALNPDLATGEAYMDGTEIALLLHCSPCREVAFLLV
jgi:cyclopropane-fatty-acyl-phospholipid synthase